MATLPMIMLSVADLPAEADPAGFRASTGSTSTIKNLGGGDRVVLDSTAGKTAVRPVPRSDGTRPGLVLTSSSAGAFVQSLDGSPTPTPLGSTKINTKITYAAGQQLEELHLVAVGRDGRPARAHVNIFDVATGAVSASRELPGDPSAGCSTDSYAESSCVLLPPGSYSVMGFVSTNPAGMHSTADERTAQSVALVGDPEAKITGNRTISLDARAARPIKISTPGSRTKINPGDAMQLGYSRTAANGKIIKPNVMPAALLDQNFYLQPTKPVTIGKLDTLTRVRLEAPDIELSAPHLSLHPEYYDPVWFSDVASDWPVVDGSQRRRVVDIGQATAADLAHRQLNGAIAVAERSDELSVAEQSNAAAAAGAALIVIYNDGPGDNDDPNGTGVKIKIPTLRLNHAEGVALTRLSSHATVQVSGESASPYLYDLVIKEHGRIPSDLSYRYTRSDLSQQRRSFYGQPQGGSTFSEAAYQYQPGDEFSISIMYPFRNAPRTRVEYRLPDPDTQWTYAAATPELPYNALFPDDPVQPMLLSDTQHEAYQPGQVTNKPVGTAPVTAALNVPVQRSGDRLRVSIDGFADSNGNQGPNYSEDGLMATDLTITADGKVVGETTHLPDGVAAVPAGTSTIGIDYTADNLQSWAELSTHTETHWAFASTSTDGSVRTEPLLLADYDLPVDLANTVSTRDHRAIGLRLATQDGAEPTMIKTATLDVSYDDGDSWRPATLTRSGSRYAVQLPPGRGYASLRLHAASAGGSTLDQTIIRAFLVR